MQATSEMNNILWFWIAIHACCQNTPNIFNWRQIWWVRRPVSWLYVSWNVLIQPTNGCSRSMTPSVILLKNSVFLLREKLPLSNIASIRDSIKCRKSWTGYCQCNIPSSFLLLGEWSEAELIHEQSSPQTITDELNFIWSVRGTLFSCEPHTVSFLEFGT